MLLREHDEGVIAIAQTSHSWISGQLARAWGNDRFGAVEPLEDVCLAAEQHDVGMSGWDMAPSLNPRTGLPYSFIEMPVSLHVEQWTEGPRRLLGQSRYAALLASLHGARLQRRRDLDKLDPSDAGTVRDYLTGEESFQHELTASLRADPHSAGCATPAQVDRNSQLVWIWDYLSLALLLDWAPCTAHEVPAADGAAELALSPTGHRRVLTLDPWPLSRQRLTVHCEGRRLAGRYAEDEELRRALREAPWERVEFELVAAE